MAGFASKPTVGLSAYVVTVTVGYIMASPSSKQDCWSVPLICHCHSWFYHDLSQLQIQLFVSVLPLDSLSEGRNAPPPSPG